MLSCSQALQYKALRSSHIKYRGVYRWIQKLSECKLVLTQRGLIRVVAHRLER